QEGHAGARQRRHLPRLVLLGDGPSKTRPSRRGAPVAGAGPTRDRSGARRRGRGRCIRPDALVLPAGRPAPTPRGGGADPRRLLPTRPICTLSRPERRGPVPRDKQLPAACTLPTPLGEPLPIPHVGPPTPLHAGNGRAFGRFADRNGGLLLT